MSSRNLVPERMYNSLTLMYSLHNDTRMIELNPQRRRVTGCSKTEGNPSIVKSTTSAVTHNNIVFAIIFAIVYLFLLLYFWNSFLASLPFLYVVVTALPVIDITVILYSKACVPEITIVLPQMSTITSLTRVLQFSLWYVYFRAIYQRIKITSSMI